MTGIKRRQTIKDSVTPIPSQIPFIHEQRYHSKSPFATLTGEKLTAKASTKSAMSHFMGSVFCSSKRTATGLSLPFDQGGKDSNNKSTAYRSLQRVKSLLNNSTSTPRSPQDDSSPDSHMINNFLKKAEMSQDSKPSSVTTACTSRHNMSATKSVASSKFGSSQKRSRQTDTSSSVTPNKRESKKAQKGLVGSKRGAGQDLDKIEYLCQLHSSNSKAILAQLKLRDKKTGRVFEFPIHKESAINFANNPVITGFDMSKLEVEYDYDTDNEQLTHSHNMLLRELFQAIEFFVKEDPLKLVENVRL